MPSAKTFICAPSLHSIEGAPRAETTATMCPSSDTSSPGSCKPAGKDRAGFCHTTLYLHCLLSTGTLCPWASCNTSLDINLCNVYPCKGLGGLIAHEVVEKWWRNAVRLLDWTIVFAVLFILTERSKREKPDANLAGH